MFRKQWES